MLFNQKAFFLAGALFGALAIIFGAFGSHALKSRLTADRLNVFEIGVRYQMYHALLLISLAWAISFFTSSLVSSAGWIIVLGTCVFSGSLYCLVLFDAAWWGAVTPIGGMILLIGWVMLALGAFLTK